MFIEGELRLEDLAALQKNFLRTSRKVKKRIRILTIIVIIVLLTLFYLFQLNVSPLHIIFNIILITFSGALTPTLSEVGMVRKLKKTNYKTKLGPFEINLHDQGITFQRQGDVKQFAWKDMHSVTKDENHFFLYYNSQAAIIIPKNALNSEKDFIAYLSNHIKQSKIDLVPVVRPKRKVIIITLSIALAVILTLLYVYPTNIAIATQKVDDLFIEEDDIKPGDSSKIKESTNQKKIDEAMEAIQ